MTEATRMQAVPSFFRGLGEAGRDNEWRQKTFTEAHGWEAGRGKGSSFYCSNKVVGGG